MSREITPHEFEVFRWYIAAHYLRLIQRDDVRSKLDFGTGMHLVYMLGEIEGGAGSTKKLGEQAANRWIGFVQGVLQHAGVCTIDELRAATTECMEMAAIHQHVTIEPVGSSEWAAVIYGEQVHVFDVDLDAESIDAEITAEKMRIVEQLNSAGWYRMGDPDARPGTEPRPQNVDQVETRAAIAQARKILAPKPQSGPILTARRLPYDG